MREGYKECMICGSESYIPFGRTCDYCRKDLENAGAAVTSLVENLVRRIEDLEKKARE